MSWSIIFHACKIGMYEILIDISFLDQWKSFKTSLISFCYYDNSFILLKMAKCLLERIHGWAFIDNGATWQEYVGDVILLLFDIIKSREPYKHLGAGIYTKCSTLLCIGSAKVLGTFVIGVSLDRYVTQLLYFFHFYCM